jgi:hypothetical protein
MTRTPKPCRPGDIVEAHLACGSTCPDDEHEPHTRTYAAGRVSWDGCLEDWRIAILPLEHAQLAADTRGDMRWQGPDVIDWRLFGADGHGSSIIRVLKAAGASHVQPDIFDLLETT